MIGGMLAASLLAIFFIPVSFDVVERFGNWSFKKKPACDQTRCQLCRKDRSHDQQTDTYRDRVAASLSGCKVGPNYQRPRGDGATDSIAGLRPTLSNQPAAHPFGETKWRSRFSG